MGPSLIFDKSFLEGLNPDEAVWLDQFYLSVITPLFFVETMADLDKKTRSGRTPEDVVGSLAYRTPDLHAKSNVHHRALLQGELEGVSDVEMERGVPHIGGGRYVDLEGKMGAFFEASPEEEAMKRWQEHKFLELERSHAKKWRDALSNLNLGDIYEQYQSRFAGHSKPRSLEEVKKMAEEFMDYPDQGQILKAALGTVGAAPEFMDKVMSRWQNSGRPPIRKFAPYLTHITTVDYVFSFGIGCDLIGRGRPSHKIDVAYLYYLPFCKIFTSNDRLHKLLVPLFLRRDQTFISGDELKSDLKLLDEHYSSFPVEDIEKGVYFFASRPPDDARFLTTRMWDKYKSPIWREHRGMAPLPTNPVRQKMMEGLMELERKAKAEGTSKPTQPGESNQMMIKRMVSGKRGKWTRFSPEIMNRRKDADGNWDNGTE